MTRVRKSRAVMGPQMLGWARASEADNVAHARVGNSWRSRSACGASLGKFGSHDYLPPCRKCLRALVALGLSQKIPARAVEAKRVKG